MKIRKNSKSGQAMMEMAISMVVFIILISAAASYYKVMRTAIIRQEVARNMIFAKINNSGNLTSLPPDVSGGRLYLGGVESGFNIAGGGGIVTQRDSCLMVIPGGDANISVGVPYEERSVASTGGAVKSQEVKITTYAVIYRRNGASCVN
jgi:hypothetical protein